MSPLENPLRGLRALRGLLGWLMFLICAARAGIALPSPAAATTSGVATGSTVLGFGGSATYTGQLGPVSRARLICICVSSDPNLNSFIGCLEIATNGGTYFAATGNMNTYFVVGFLDLNPNIILDPGEPYEIYNERSAPPGDPVIAGLAQTAINFSFGDENLWPPATLTPTRTASATPTQVATRTETPTPSDTQTTTPTHSPSAAPSVTPSPAEEPATTPTASPIPTAVGCRGDCDGSGDVLINELITLVNIALGSAPISSCVAGDADESATITVNEIVAAVNAALSGCAPSPSADRQRHRRSRLQGLHAHDSSGPREGSPQRSRTIGDRIFSSSQSDRLARLSALIS